MRWDPLPFPNLFAIIILLPSFKSQLPGIPLSNTGFSLFLIFTNLMVMPYSLKTYTLIYFVYPSQFGHNSEWFQRPGEYSLTWSLTSILMIKSSSVCSSILNLLRKTLYFPTLDSRNYLWAMTWMNTDGLTKTFFFLSPNYTLGFLSRRALKFLARFVSLISSRAA